MFKIPNLKYKKYHKTKIRFAKKRLVTADKLSLGEFGLLALEHGYINQKQIESMRRAIISVTNKQGKLIFRVKPEMPVTKKPIGVRMGKGKGPISNWLANVKPGKIILETMGLKKNCAFEALNYGSSKLPIKVRIVSR